MVSLLDPILTGVISAAVDPPGIDRARWLALIAESAHLDSSDEAPTSARIVVEGAMVGHMVWSKTSANEIEVYGVLEQVQDAAWNVAAELQAQFVTLAELTSC